MRPLIQQKSDDIGDQETVKEYNLLNCNYAFTDPNITKGFSFQISKKQNPKLEKTGFGNVNSNTGKPRK